MFRQSEIINKVDITTQQSCLHSKLPEMLKEAHVYEFDNTILACSTFTGRSNGPLKCFKWSENSWETFKSPTQPLRGAFISSVKVIE